jgi:hypothetical protein
VSSWGGVADLLKDTETGDAYHDASETAVRFCLEPRYWSCGIIVQVDTRLIHADGSRLWILQTGVNHDQIRQFFAAIRRATPDGTGPFIARCRVEGNTSTDTVVRFYDVRDLARRGAYHAGKRDENIEILGSQSLAGLVAHRGRDNPWYPPAQAYVLFGRLVVEQTPAGHEEVRQILADVRAGKSIEGFTLSSADKVRSN